MRACIDYFRSILSAKAARGSAPCVICCTAQLFVLCGCDASSCGSRFFLSTLQKETHPNKYLEEKSRVSGSDVVVCLCQHLMRREGTWAAEGDVLPAFRDMQINRPSFCRWGTFSPYMTSINSMAAQLYGLTFVCIHQRFLLQTLTGFPASAALKPPVIFRSG